MSDIEPGWVEYFSGGVPTGDYFHMTLDELREISASDKSPGINRLQELCFIGLLSYFEAFCKDHFASLINIEPSFVSNMKAAGYDVCLDATHVISYGNVVGCRIGFVLAEKYDFGTAQKINALFTALLKVTPFNKDEAHQYTALLRDRNLLVHHGGTYTISYLEQLDEPRASPRTDAFFGSRVVTAQDVLAALTFIRGIARKLTKASHSAFVRYLNERAREYGGEREKALEAMLWWSDDQADQ